MSDEHEMKEAKKTRREDQRRWTKSLEGTQRGLMLETESRTMVLGAVEAVCVCTISGMSDVTLRRNANARKDSTSVNLRR